MCDNKTHDKSGVTAMEFTAQCARSVRLITGQEQEGEIPAAVEYRRKHGNGYLPLYLVPDGELAQSGAVGVKLLQGTDGAWKAVLYAADNTRTEWDVTPQTVDALFELGGITNPIYAPDFIASPEQERQANAEAAGASPDAAPW